MSVADYGHAGAWTEALGIIAPLQEMMLQSWDGIIRLFPAFPEDLDASFTDWRAEGAFLVTASHNRGVITGVSILSERGGTCAVCVPWSGGTKIVREDDTVVPVRTAEADTIEFDTNPGGRYFLAAIEAE